MDRRDLREGARGGPDRVSGGNKFYRARARFVAADKTDTGSQWLVYPPIIMHNRSSRRDRLLPVLSSWGSLKTSYAEIAIPTVLGQ